MPRRLRSQPIEPTPAPIAASPPVASRTRVVYVLVVTLSALSWSLATLSLLQEGPTIDEVVHLPAGLSYWETGDFRMYPHNPPLVKLIAAAPVFAAKPRTAELYQTEWWKTANKAGFAHTFALLNADRYFDLFTRARLVMPLFGVAGGLLVFAWSRRLYGAWGGVISLALWSLCPNILAHTRLVTTDVGATVAGFGATFAFWSYAKRPTWKGAALAGVLLGAAQLTKFSLLLLYGLWPVLWVIQDFATRSGPDSPPRLRRWSRAALHAPLVIGLSILVIDAGYGFTKLGRPLGSFAFTSDALTVDRVPPVAAPRVGRASGPPLHEGLLQYRVNRFKGTWLGAIPSPLPADYLIGFDEQKMEAEGIPPKATLYADDPAVREAEREGVRGYPVYLDGDLRNESWWYYYFATLAYKVPEGTWVLVLASFALLVFFPKCRAPRADELSLLLIPAVLMLVMSFATNIALGLRYVLPIAPYVFTSTGKLARWAEASTRPRLAAVVILIALFATAVSTARIQPSFLAYFNDYSGGPARGSEHLIDSNLDWGQDLPGLKRWVDEHAPGRRIGIAYFGQINPSIFALAEGHTTFGPNGRRPPPGVGLDWFLPPALPGKLPERPDLTIRGPEPGLYAVSASLMRGLSWRVYVPERWEPISARGNAFSYFAGLRPIDHIGHSILIYEITPEQARRLARLWTR